MRDCNGLFIHVFASVHACIMCAGDSLITVLG